MRPFFLIRLFSIQLILLHVIHKNLTRLIVINLNALLGSYLFLNEKNE